MQTSKLSMNLSIDVGNTRVKAAVFENNTIVCISVFDKRRIIAEIKKIIKKYTISEAIMSSVAVISEAKKSKIQDYKDLLAEGLVEPTEMELYICNADGSNLRQLTNLGNANWSPFFHPSGEKILFSSNFESERGFPFNLYLIDIDGKNLERVTHSDTFDAFPVFSNDGKKLIFSSNRNNGGGRDTNLFIAEWQD